MKLNYETMTPGQEFWATHHGCAMHCRFIDYGNISVNVVDMKNGRHKSITYLPSLGLFIPFDNELEALRERMRIEKELFETEMAEIQARIDELEGK